MGTGIAPPTTTLIPTTPGTPPHPPRTRTLPEPRHMLNWEVVGLKSVAQLTLEAFILDLVGITEVYNLVIAGDR